MPETEASELDQIMESFSFMAPYFDKSLQLQPNPRQQKARRKGEPRLPAQEATAPNQHPSQQALLFMQTMAKLVLRHEQNWSSLQSTDSFILFFKQEANNPLKGLAVETQKWQQTRQQNPPAVTQPLRQHLVLWLLKSLQDRLQQISQTPKTDELIQTCLQRKVLLEDLSWPFLRWDPAKSGLILDKKKPITMAKMIEHVGELLEDFRDPTLVVRFHGMATNDPKKTVPWRLQLNLRSQRAYDLLLELCHNSIWTVISTALKPHTAQQSNLAKSLQSMLKPPKGKGKGKQA